MRDGEVKHLFNRSEVKQMTRGCFWLGFLLGLVAGGLSVLLIMLIKT